MEQITIYVEYLDPDETPSVNDLVDPLEEIYEPTLSPPRRISLTYELADEVDVCQVLNLASSLTPEGEGEDSSPILEYAPVGLTGPGFDHVYPLTVSGQAQIMDLLDKLSREPTKAD